MKWAESRATALHGAMAGWGTAEDQLIRVIICANFKENGGSANSVQLTTQKERYNRERERGDREGDGYGDAEWGVLFDSLCQSHQERQITQETYKRMSCTQRSSKKDPKAGSSSHARVKQSLQIQHSSL